MGKGLDGATIEEGAFWEGKTWGFEMGGMCCVKWASEEEVRKEKWEGILGRIFDFGEKRKERRGGSPHG